MRRRGGGWRRGRVAMMMMMMRGLWRRDGGYAFLWRDGEVYIRVVKKSTDIWPVCLSGCYDGLYTKLPNPHPMNHPRTHSHHPRTKKPVQSSRYTHSYECIVRTLGTIDTVRHFELQTNGCPVCIIGTLLVLADSLSFLPQTGRRRGTGGEMG